MTYRKTDIELLVKKGLITKKQLSEAEKEAYRTGSTVERGLEKLGYISEIDIAKAIAENYKIPFVNLSEHQLDPEVLKLVPKSVARKYRVIPISKKKEVLTIATADAQDVMAIDAVRKISDTDMIDRAMSTPDMINSAIDRCYGAGEEMIDIVKDIKKDAFESDIGVPRLEEIAQEAPIIKLADVIIEKAAKEHASDIHIEPEKDLVRVRYRISGILHEVQRLPKHLQDALISRMKIMANMDIAETRKAQDGRIRVNRDGADLDLRVSTFPTVHGENLVFRLLYKNMALLEMENIGFSHNDMEKFNKLIHRPYGILLVTGPTGSGKTTTLYVALSAINSIEKNIVTVEDPVEYEIPFIRQTQINPKAGITFSNGLRYILRQDPDIIMVGEIRDTETAEVAIHAALTGHLVLSTLHTNDAPSALSRLIDMGIEPFLVTSCVAGVLSQRLVRNICPACREEYSPPAEFLKSAGIPAGSTFFRGAGCDECDYTGYKGQTGVFEMLVVDDSVREMVSKEMPSSVIKKKSMEAGKMNSLFEDGLDKAKRGITTLEEVLRVTAEEE